MQTHIQPHAHAGILPTQDLLNQTSHYSDKARKASLEGLSDLFSKHPQELRQHTHLFFSKIAERVSDGDAPVRSALRHLLREHVLPRLDPGHVRPFMPVMMAHLSSAMTNLNMEVRLDALNFLDVLVSERQPWGLGC
jgi:pre-rRNA-processing protein IPI1